MLSKVKPVPIKLYGWISLPSIAVGGIAKLIHHDETVSSISMASKKVISMETSIEKVEQPLYTVILDVDSPANIRGSSSPSGAGIASASCSYIIVIPGVSKTYGTATDSASVQVSSGEVVILPSVKDSVEVTLS